MKYILSILLVCLTLSACGNTSVGIIGGADGPTDIIVTKKEDKTMYKTISQDEAKTIMDTNEDIVILDVREQDEFNEGHIPGAILIPYTEIEDKAEEMLPEKDKEILVYCRSGRRSKIAAQALAHLGYTEIKEFGGIIDWEYEIEK